MELTSEILEILGGLILVFASSGLWYRFIFKDETRSFYKFLLFPITHLTTLLQVKGNAAAFLILYCYVNIVDGVLALFIIASPLVYMIEWSLFIFLDTFIVTVFLFKELTTKTFMICLGTILVFVLVAFLSTSEARNYEISNRYDFIASVYLFAASVSIVIAIVIKDRFIQEMESFFIFFGFIIYSFLHSLATIILAFNFVENVDFAFYATNLTFLFWILTVPWILRLRRKLTSLSPSPSSSCLPG